MPDSHHLRQFLLLLFALLLPCFALWYFASDAIVLPAIGFAKMILTAWLPDIVETLVPRGGEALLVTRFGELDGRHVSAQQTGEALALVINTRILSYSIPFYTALHFALAGDRLWSRYFNGLVALYVLLIASLVSLALKDLMVLLGTTFTDHPAAAIPQPNVIALLYQLSVLIIPPLAPVVIWVWQNRDAPLFGALPRLSDNRKINTAGERAMVETKKQVIPATRNPVKVNKSSSCVSIARNRLKPDSTCVSKSIENSKAERHK